MKVRVDSINTIIDEEAFDHIKKGNVVLMDPISSVLSDLSKHNER